MTITRRLVLGLGLVVVILMIVRVVWMARSSGAASAPAGRSAVPSDAPAPAPHRAGQRDAGRAPSQPPPGMPPPRRAAPPAPEDRAPPGRPPPHVDEGPLEREPAVAPAEAGTAPRRTRRVEHPSFRQRLQPGLCADPREAAQVQQTLISRFREEAWGAARLYVDPRLPEGAHLPLLHHLDQAEREVFAQLELDSRRPDVFAYFDAELLVAAACTNREVVAFYDGALHVVVTRPDVQASVLHEYTHHALMSRGLLGPAWAQEGLAMHVAREVWWLDPARLEQVREAPIPLEAMEYSIPYTLLPEQAVLFYVQSASMVACFVRGDGARLRRLMDAMGGAGESTHGASSHDIMQLLEPSAWHECIDGLMRYARSVE